MSEKTLLDLGWGLIVLVQPDEPAPAPAASVEDTVGAYLEGIGVTLEDLIDVAKTKLVAAGTAGVDVETPPAAATETPAPADPAGSGSGEAETPAWKPSGAGGQGQPQDPQHAAQATPTWALPGAEGAVEAAPGPDAPDTPPDAASGDTAA